MAESFDRLCPACGGPAKVQWLPAASGDGFPDALLFQCGRCGVVGWLQGPRRVHDEAAALDAPLAFTQGPLAIDLPAICKVASV